MMFTTVEAGFTVNLEGPDIWKSSSTIGSVGSGLSVLAIGVGMGRACFAFWPCYTAWLSLAGAGRFPDCGIIWKKTSTGC